jgi:hypothetical protein
LRESGKIKWIIQDFLIYFRLVGTVEIVGLCSRLFDDYYADSAFLNRFEELFGPMLISRLRFGTISFNWSSHGQRYRLPRTPINLSRKFKRRLHHFMAACEIRKSTIRNAGTGVFLLESVQEGQIMFKYGGRRISFPEADRLSKMVRKLLCSLPSTNSRVYGSNKLTGIGYPHQGKYNACVLL